jgi:hypothetical protein
MIGVRGECAYCAVPTAVFETIAGRTTMAKGQLRGNKEAKKPKKPKQPVVPAGSLLTPPKSNKPIKPQH